VTALLITSDSHAEALRRTLAEGGHRAVVAVATADDAIAQLTRDERIIELVLFDLCPNERDQLLAIPRLVRCARGAPVVVIANEEALSVAWAAGAAEGVARPVRHVELAARLRRLRRARERDTKSGQRERKLSDAVERLESANRELESRVCIDALTGVANRRQALVLLEAECRRSLREGSPLAIVTSDVDTFHTFNERYGEPAGDRCLQRVTRALVDCLRRPSDFLGRYGGDELLAVLPNTNASGAAVLAHRMREVVQDLAIPHATSPFARVVTISLGFASLTRTACNAELLVSVADAALLRAKAAGRNRVAGSGAPILDLRQPLDRWKRFTPLGTPVADPIPAFLTTIRARAKSVARAAHHGSLDGASALAHTLKAAAIERGLEPLAPIARDLEQAARLADASTIEQLANEVAGYIERIQVAYPPMDEDDEVMRTPPARS
jgi:diguanylate cyclase (GGDEF)-like protein